MDKPILFTGACEHNIDAKHRLSIPSQFRSQMDAERDGTGFYMVPGDRAGTLSLYPENTFRRRLESWPDHDNPEEELSDYNDLYFALSTFLEMDKQGRVLLPADKLEQAGLGREVYVTGRRDHLMLWNKVDYEGFLAENWPRLPDIRRQARKFFRRSETGGGPD